MAFDSDRENSSTVTNLPDNKPTTPPRFWVESLSSKELGDVFKSTATNIFPSGKYDVFKVLPENLLKVRRRKVSSPGGGNWENIKGGDYEEVSRIYYSPVSEPGKFREQTSARVVTQNGDIASVAMRRAGEMPYGKSSIYDQSSIEIIKGESKGNGLWLQVGKEGQLIQVHYDAEGLLAIFVYSGHSLRSNSIGLGKDSPRIQDITKSITDGREFQFGHDGQGILDPETDELTLNVKIGSEQAEIKLSQHINQDDIQAKLFPVDEFSDPYNALPESDRSWQRADLLNLVGIKWKPVSARAFPGFNDLPDNIPDSEN